MKEKLEITKKKPNNINEYKSVSLRIKKENVNKIEEIASKTNNSKNEIINIFINYGLENYSLKD